MRKKNPHRDLWSSLLTLPFRLRAQHKACATILIPEQKYLRQTTGKSVEIISEKTRKRRRWWGVCFGCQKHPQVDTLVPFILCWMLYITIKSNDYYCQSGKDLAAFCGYKSLCDICISQFRHKNLSSVNTVSPWNLWRNWFSLMSEFF